jgi:hypothetical protein
MAFSIKLGLMTFFLKKCSLFLAERETCCTG